MSKHLYLIGWFFFLIKEPKLAKVEYDFEARNSDELSLDRGDIVTLLEQSDSGWWKGDLNGKIGVFPANVSLYNRDWNQSTFL